MDYGLESKAIIILNDSNTFTVQTINVDVPSHSHVRIKMKYASYSVHDMIQNSYAKHAEYPYLAGYDGVGIVDEVGEGVEEVDKGDYVAIFMVPGNYALQKSNV